MIEQKYCVFVSMKVDKEVLRLVKAASALEGETAQDWASDILNAAAAERVGQKPIKRKPAPPHKGSSK